MEAVENTTWLATQIPGEIQHLQDVSKMNDTPNATIDDRDILSNVGHGDVEEDGAMTASSDDNTETVTDNMATDSFVPEAVKHIEAEVALYVDRIGGTLVLFGGLTGNIITIQVLRRPKLRHSTTSLYLTSLAVADALGLLIGQGGRHWVRSMTGYDMPSHADWYCKAWFAMGSTFLISSDWILAGVSFERFLAIWFPLKVKTLTSRTKAKFYIASVAVLSLVYNFVVSWLSYIQVTNESGSFCTVRDHITFVMDYRPWIEFCIQSLVPATIIITSNVLLLLKVLMAHNQRHKQLQQHQQQSSSYKMDAETRSLLLMLVTISLAFVLLTSPLHILWVVQKVYKSSYDPATREAAVNRMIWSFMIFLVYLNHAINFLLYVISGSEFRKELTAWFRGACGCVKSSPGESTSHTLITSKGSRSTSSIPLSDNHI